MVWVEWLGWGGAINRTSNEPLGGGHVKEAVKGARLGGELVDGGTKVEDFRGTTPSFPYRIGVGGVISRGHQALDLAQHVSAQVLGTVEGV